MGNTVITGAPATGAVRGWSVDSLCLQLLGALNQDRNTSGSAPDRLKAIVRARLRALWTMRDWTWQHREGTLAITAGQSSVALPEDFRKMASNYIQDPATGSVLTMVPDARRWKYACQAWRTTDTGFPQIGAILKDTAETEFTWKLHFRPAARDSYSLPMLYMPRCPLDLGVTHADYRSDGDVIPMPEEMHEGWELDATWRAEKAFVKDPEIWKASKRGFDEWLAAAAESNETQTDADFLVTDGYGDIDALPGMDMPAEPDPYKVLPGL